MRKSPGSLLVLLLLAGAAAPSSADTPTATEILSGTIFGEKEIAGVLEGEAVTTPVREVSEREIGVGHACLVPPGRRASLAVLRSTDPLMPDKYKDATGPLDLTALENGFAPLEFGRGSRGEARRLLSIEPGYEFNLSEAEMAELTSLEPAKGEEVEAVEAELRRIFAARVRAYRAGGTAEMAPFARANTRSDSPGDELQRTTEGMDGLAKAFPSFHQALLRYPHDQPEHQEFWFWTRIRVLGRPVFMLHQRLAAEQGGVEMVVERQIYASHFLDVGQTVSATLPVQEGTLLFVIYRTWVDRWAGPGFAVGTKRKVGTELISSILAAQIRELGLCRGEP